MPKKAATNPDVETKVSLEAAGAAFALWFASLELPADAISALQSSWHNNGELSPAERATFYNTIQSGVMKHLQGAAFAAALIPIFNFYVKKRKESGPEDVVAWFYLIARYKRAGEKRPARQINREIWLDVWERVRRSSPSVKARLVELSGQEKEKWKAKTRRSSEEKFRRAMGAFKLAARRAERIEAGLKGLFAESTDVPLPKHPPVP